MNIVDTEATETIIAKTCGYREVTYAFVDSYHGLCIDKKDIISAELKACQKLLKYATNDVDKKAIEKEIAELRMTLDLLP
jgi:hypothetical protein